MLINFLRNMIVDHLRPWSHKRHQILKKISEHLSDEALPIRYTPGKFTDHKPCDSGDMNFSNCQVTSVTWSKVHMVLIWEGCHSVSRHIFCFVVHYLLEVYLISHMTLYEHLIEVSCEFVRGRSWRYVTTLISLVFISPVIVKI